MASALKALRRRARFGSPARTFNLPPHSAPVQQRTPKPGYHTYYLSCDRRTIELYTPHAVKHVHDGFRSVMVAPSGLQFEPPSVVQVAVQDGDTFEHASEWARSNPLDDIVTESRREKRPIADIKLQKKAQDAFQVAVARVAGVEEALAEAQEALQSATAEVIAVQGVQSVCIDGDYYDPTYSREKLYMKKRQARFNPEEAPEAEAPRKRGKKKAARNSTRGAAKSGRRRAA